MLTGRRAYEGEDISDTLAAVLTREPDFAAVPPATPAPVVSLMRRCLERDPKRRLRDIGEGRLALESPFNVPATSMVAPATAPVRRTDMYWYSRSASSQFLSSRGDREARTPDPSSGPRSARQET
jgi:serine/threonine-protein kinase